MVPFFSLGGEGGFTSHEGLEYGREDVARGRGGDIKDHIILASGHYMCEIKFKKMF